MPVVSPSLAFVTLVLHLQAVRGGTDVMGLQRSDKHRESIGHLRHEELTTKLLELLQQRECPDSPGRE